MSTRESNRLWSLSIKSTAKLLKVNNEVLQHVRLGSSRRICFSSSVKANSLPDICDAITHKTLIVVNSVPFPVSRGLQNWRAPLWIHSQKNQPCVSTMSMDSFGFQQNSQIVLSIKLHVFTLFSFNVPLWGRQSIRFRYFNNILSKRELSLFNQNWTESKTYTSFFL